VFLVRQQFKDPFSWIPGPYELTLNFAPATFPKTKSPVIQMKPGEKQFWRVANTTTQAFMSLQFMFGDAAQTLEVISRDGVPVNGDTMVTSIDLPPAGRAEFIVTGPPAGTTATLVNGGFDTGPVGNGNPAQILANVVATTAATQQAAPQTATSTAPGLAVTQRFSGLAPMQPITKRKLFFSEAALGSNPPVNFFVTVEGQRPRLFSMNEPPNIVTKIGAVEDWTIENRTSEEHAFHMHQIHF